MHAAMIVIRFVVVLKKPDGEKQILYGRIHAQIVALKLRNDGARLRPYLLASPAKFANTAAGAVVFITAKQF